MTIDARDKVLSLLYYLYHGIVVFVKPTQTDYNVPGVTICVFTHSLVAKSVQMAGRTFMIYIIIYKYIYIHIYVFRNKTSYAYTKF